MPYITEELWQRLPHGGETLSLPSNPRPTPRSSTDEPNARCRL
jgi:valyl-tRNA synthetase